MKVLLNSTDMPSNIRKNFSFPCFITSDMALIYNSYYRVDRAQIYASLDRRNYLRNSWTSVIKPGCINTRQNICFKLNDEKRFYFCRTLFFACRKILNMNCTSGNHFNQQFN